MGHVTELVQKIEPIFEATQKEMPDSAPDEKEFVDEVARRNVRHVLDEILARSEIIAELVREGSVDLVGGLYHLRDGHVEFFGGLAEQINDDSVSA